MEKELNERKNDLITRAEETLNKTKEEKSIKSVRRVCWIWWWTLRFR